MTLPPVLSEFETIRQALAGKSLARYGDGELRLMAGRGTAVTQEASPKLAAELRDILKNPPANCLVCLPIAKNSPKGEMWARYQDHSFLKYFGPGPYGSAFISRPDSAPWIDTDAYWRDVRSLWEGKDVIFVAGTDRSLRDDDFASARNFCRIEAPRRDAYAHIDQIEAGICAIAQLGTRVILCLGPTATVLAARLARKGIHALDLGHIGQYMRHAGAYRFTLDDLASPKYRAQLEQLHAKRKGWGNDGHKHAPAVKEFAERLGVTAILDYGCGQEALKKALGDGFKVEGFDVGIPSRAILPKPAGLVACTDCIEHVEGKKLDNVLSHICLLAEKGIYLVIATRPANAKLPDGSNAHKIIKDAQWWIDRVSQLEVAVEQCEVRGNHEVAIWLRK